MDPKKIVLTGIDDAPETGDHSDCAIADDIEDDATGEDETPPSNLAVQMGVTSDGYVAIRFDKKLRVLVIPPEQAIGMANALAGNANKAAQIRSRIVVPTLGIPPNRPS